MKPLYSRIEWPKIAAYDLEADFWIDIKQVCHVDEYGNRLQFPTVNQYLDWLFTQFEGDIVFAHAGGHYDHRFLIYAAMERGWEFRTAMSAGSIVILTINNGERVIKFGDSYRLMPNPLKQIGETIGLHKLEVNPSKMHELSQKEILDYCFRDCEIVLRGLQMMRDALVNVGADFAFTLASIATRYVRRMPGIRWENFVLKVGGRQVPHPKTRLWDRECFNAFHGGRTEMFRRGVITEPVYWYDIVSSYPTSMREDLPFYFKGFFTPPKNLVNVESFLDHYGITACEVDIPDDFITVLPTVKRKATHPHVKQDDNLLTFKTGRHFGYWTNIELMEALQHGAKIPIASIRGQYRFEGVPFMRGFVDTFYKLRQDAKNRNDTFGSYAYKILLNSAYGKLVETIDRQAFVTRGELAEAEREGHVIKTTPVTGLFCVESQEEGPFRHTAAGAYVTAHSRLRLFRKAREMNDRKAIVYYCDTDSLMVSEPMREDETGKGLGDWEHVDTLQSLELVLPKVYRAESQSGKVTYKCKGCPITRKFEGPEMAEKRWRAFKLFRDHEEDTELAAILGVEGITGFVSDINAGTLHPRRKQKRCKRCKGTGDVAGLMCSECVGKGYVEGPLIRALRSSDRKRKWDGATSIPLSSEDDDI